MTAPGTRIRSAAPNAPDAAAETPAIAAVRAVLARVRRRRTLVVLALALVVLGVGVLTLTTGDLPLSPARLLATLAGHGTPLERLVVFTLRLPRWTTAALVGVAFALSGSLFQSTLRNTLASPDIIGVSGGASTAAVAATLLFHQTGPVVALAAAGGAAVVAAAVAVLSWRHGFAGARFVLVGVAFAFLVSGALGWMFTRADVQEASGALVWLVGSVSSPSWNETGWLAIALVVLVPAAFLTGRPLRALALGPETAHGLGTRPTAASLTAIAIAVLLAAVATAIAGPVAFVAFTAAPIARRLVGVAGLEPAASALTGAALVTAADLIAQHLPGGFDAPVGLVTGLVGAPYLLWLLASGGREGAPT